MPTRRQTLTALGLAGATTVAGLSACSKDKPSFNDGQPKEPEPKAKAAITSPADGAADVIAAAEIVYTSSEATDTKFELTDSAGKAVPGKMHPDGKGWMPDKMLAYGATYTATVTATGDDGKAVTAKSTFTTMAQPSNEVRVTSFMSDNTQIGTAMPLIFQMTRDIPKDARAGLQRRMMVTTEPAVEGVWNWYTPRELHWRPKEFWKPGTKIFVDARVGGVPCGDGHFAKRNLTLTVSAGRQLIMTVDDHSSPKVMVVTVDGQEIKRIPVSLGKPEWQSSSGVMVIIEKKAHDIFDTRNDPNAREKYVAEVEFAQRTTWSGEHIHAAPWSVQHQGVRNVSHGCINMSTDNARWLFEQTRVGDPVITSNTGATLKYGDGWTDWSKSFEEYAKGSAIPYEPPTAQPSPTASP
ncbi:L,D-transpeptidase [Allorhizocola rhizosphaerae]|uniref:L,D-transpeptidase n=1 Tax=Allorhizocola rhizosphaerae TaxID=1872709 RepID=UPI001FE947E8|nr:Ig-like domain-containing protein [Allorhizocola rhizosphaerae]